MEQIPEPPSRPPTRFDLELEFVLSLSNPSYLQYLAVNYSTLLIPSENAKSTSPNSDTALFTRYLTYLHDYWRRPEYAKYLTHPAATLRNLELLQNEQFRRDLARPDVVARLWEGLGLDVLGQGGHGSGEGEGGGEGREGGV